MRKAAYSYGRHLLPRLGAFEPLYYALNLNDPSCKGELEALSGPSEGPKHAPLPRNAVYVTPVRTAQSEDGSFAAPFSCIQQAADVAAAIVSLVERPTHVFVHVCECLSESDCGYPSEVGELSTIVAALACRSVRAQRAPGGECLRGAQGGPQGRTHAVCRCTLRTRAMSLSGAGHSSPPQHKRTPPTAHTVKVNTFQ